MPRDTATDEQLVARVRAGRRRRLRGDRPPLPRRRCSASPPGCWAASHADAEDVVQDAFIRALPALRATDRPMALRPWLYMIVRNRAFDHLRRAPARATGPTRLALVAAPATSRPDDRAVAREELDGVVAEIAALPERQRLALVWRELGGASHARARRRAGHERLRAPSRCSSARGSSVARGRRRVSGAPAKMRARWPTPTAPSLIRRVSAAP